MLSATCLSVCTACKRDYVGGVTTGFANGRSGIVIYFMDFVDEPCPPTRPRINLLSLVYTEKEGGYFLSEWVGRYQFYETRDLFNVPNTTRSSRPFQNLFLIKRP